MFWYDVMSPPCISLKPAKLFINDCLSLSALMSSWSLLMERNCMPVVVGEDAAAVQEEDMVVEMEWATWLPLLLKIQAISLPWEASEMLQNPAYKFVRLPYLGSIVSRKLARITRGSCIKERKIYLILMIVYFNRFICSLCTSYFSMRLFYLLVFEIGAFGTS